MRNVLLIGGAGFIGSHTAKLLASHGFRPIVVDSLRTGKASFVRWGPLEVADIRDTNRLTGIINAYAPIAVMHFASLTSVSESYINPHAYFDINVNGTVSCLEAMRQSKNIPDFIFSSSAAVYGTAHIGPISESSELSPINIYGFTKAVCEQIADQYHRNYGVRYAVLRYFNAAGADVDSEIGEDHNPETHLIPRVIASAMGLEPAIQVNGVDYPTRDGSCIRDYVHVSDLAEAHRLALSNLESGGAPDVFNVGTGSGYSVLEVINSVEMQLGKRVKKVIGSRRSGDPPTLIASPEKAERLLGFKAQKSDLQTLITTAIKWHVRQSMVLTHAASGAVKRLETA